MSRYHRALSGARWRKVRLAALRRDDWKCQLCRGYGNEADHIQPLHRGGEPYSLSNIRILCRGCHIKISRRPRDPAWSKKLKALLQSG